MYNFITKIHLPNFLFGIEYDYQKKRNNIININYYTQFVIKTKIFSHESMC